MISQRKGGVDAVSMGLLRAFPKKIPLHPPTAEYHLPPSSQIYPILLPRETRTRRALLICNTEFEHLSQREGAEVDVKEMTKLLEGLGYRVDLHENLTSQVKYCTKQLALAPQMVWRPLCAMVTGGLRVDVALGDLGHHGNNSPWEQLCPWLLLTAGGWISTQLITGV